MILKYKINDYVILDVLPEWLLSLILKDRISVFQNYLSFIDNSGKQKFISFGATICYNSEKDAIYIGE